MNGKYLFVVKMAALFIILLALVCASIASRAEEAILYGYCDARLNVRQEMDTNSKAVDNYKPGSTIAVLEDMENGWYRVPKGYVMSQYVLNKPAGSTLFTGFCYGRLNIRASMNVKSECLGYYDKGDAINVLENMGNGWYRVPKGYVMSEYVYTGTPNYADDNDETFNYNEHPVGESVWVGYCEASLNIRKSQSKKSKCVGRYYPGDEILVLADYGNGWYRVDKGYVMAKYVVTTPTTPKIPTPAPTTSITGVAQFTKANMKELRIKYLAALPYRTKGECVTGGKALNFVNDIPIYDVVDGYAYFPSGRNIYRIPEKSFEDLTPVGENEDIIAAYRTVYFSSIDARKHNIELAATYLSRTLNPGEAYDFNAMTGTRSKEKGYLEAGAYSGGKVIKAYGGGVCQLSSTIYAAVRQLNGVKILERKVHNPEVTYLPLDMDATVNYGSIDFRFANYYDFPITIDVRASNGAIVVLVTK